MAKNTYMSGGNLRLPMVLMTAIGGGYNDAAQHSQCLYATFAHMPGIKVVVPSNAYDRLAVPNVPIPYSRPLEQFVIPQVDSIANAARDLMGAGAPAKVAA